MKIKEVMQRTGLSEKTIRYYESCGLVHTSTYRNNGRTYHEFDETSLMELRNVVLLRKAEFSIEEILTMQQEPERISEIVSSYQERISAKQQIFEKLTSDNELKDASDWNNLSLRISRDMTRIQGYEPTLHFGKFDPESPQEKQSAIDAYNRRNKRTKREKPMFRWLLFALILLCVLTLTVGTSLYTEVHLVRAALVGAENTSLAMGAYRADTGTTAELSEAELAEQIAAYNAQIALYYTEDNPCFQNYKIWNESYLRETFQNEVMYRVDGGLLNNKLHYVLFDLDRIKAKVKMTMTSYNLWIVETEAHSFTIEGAADVDEITAIMEKSNGSWKLQQIEEHLKKDNWVLQNDQEYDNFSDALEAAKEIQFSELCPLN